MKAQNETEAQANIERRLNTEITQILIYDARCRLAPTDDDYAERNIHVWRAFSLAMSLGYPCGVRIDPQEPAWPVVYIDLPTGQVSWHVPQHESGWDGHDFWAKQQRLLDYGTYITKRHRND